MLQDKKIKDFQIVNSIYLFAGKALLGTTSSSTIKISSSTLGKLSKKNSRYNEFGTKGGRVSDLNHYFKQL